MKWRHGADKSHRRRVRKWQGKSDRRLSVSEIDLNHRGAENA